MTRNTWDLMAKAIRAEMEARDFYADLAGQVKNFILNDKLKYLSREEDGHRRLLERLYDERFPDHPLKLPDNSGTSLPRVQLSKTNTLSDVLGSAMEAEKAAQKFYKSLAKILPKEDDKIMLTYLSNIEGGHLYFLNLEREQALRYEDYYETSDMMHAGP
jgi:erythrin-vacuolar iron transport family protein